MFVPKWFDLTYDNLSSRHDNYPVDEWGGNKEEILALRESEEMSYRPIYLVPNTLI